MKSGPKISVVLPVLAPTAFLRAMTEFAIQTLRLHAADPGFELIVVEADGDHLDPFREGNGWLQDLMFPGTYRYLNFTPKIGGVRELNAGIDAATGDHVVFTGNDVIAPPRWDAELLRCFEERADCGIASLSALEPGAVVGPREPLDRIVEGMYSPFCAWQRGWRMDEAYVKIYQDSDLVMRMYESGLRAYRSCRAHVHHLGRMTSDRVEPERHRRELAADERTFYARWGGSPLAMFGLIRYGVWQYGQEHRSLADPIALHHDPGAAA